jgi:hypothetical protein
MGPVSLVGLGSAIEVTARWLRFDCTGRSPPDVGWTLRAIGFFAVGGLFGRPARAVSAAERQRVIGVAVAPNEPLIAVVGDGRKRRHRPADQVCLCAHSGPVRSTFHRGRRWHARDSLLSRQWSAAGCQPMLTILSPVLMAGWARVATRGTRHGTGVGAVDRRSRARLAFAAARDYPSPPMVDGGSGPGKGKETRRHCPARTVFTGRPDTGCPDVSAGHGLPGTARHDTARHG